VQSKELAEPILRRSCAKCQTTHSQNKWTAEENYSSRIDSSCNVMAHGDAREGKYRGNWRMEWVASTLHTTSEHGVSSITTADAHTSAASSRLNWRTHRFKWTRPFSRKTKSGFCACAITFQLASTSTSFKATGSRTLLLKAETMLCYAMCTATVSWAQLFGLVFYIQQVCTVRQS